jgi:hypothetical protein
MLSAYPALAANGRTNFHFTKCNAAGMGRGATREFAIKLAISEIRSAQTPSSVRTLVASLCIQVQPASA